MKYTWILCDPECFHHEVASLSDWWHFSSRSPAAQHWSEASGQRKASVWVCPRYSECCHSDRGLRLENSGCLDLWKITLIDSVIRDIGGPGHTFMKPWVQTRISENVSCIEKHLKLDIIPYLWGITVSSFIFLPAFFLVFRAPLFSSISLLIFSSFSLVSREDFSWKMFSYFDVHPDSAVLHPPSHFSSSRGRVSSASESCPALSSAPHPASPRWRCLHKSGRSPENH